MPEQSQHQDPAAGYLDAAEHVHAHAPDEVGRRESNDERNDREQDRRCLRNETDAIVLGGFALAKRRISVDALDNIDRRADQEGGNGRDRGSNRTEDDDIHRPGGECLGDQGKHHMKARQAQ